MFEGAAAIVGSSFERAPWGWGVLVLLATITARLWPVMSRIALDRDTSILKARADDNADLRRRVADLERRLESDRTQHQIEQTIERTRSAHLSQALDALLMMLELAPDKVTEHVERIRAMRAEHARLEAAELAALRLAAMALGGETNEEAAT